MSTINLNDQKMTACVEVIKQLSKNGEIKINLLKTLYYLNDNRLDLPTTDSTPEHKFIYSVALRLMKSTNIEETKRDLINNWKNLLNIE